MLYHSIFKTGDNGCRMERRRVLKRSNSSSDWNDITANVIDRKTDGLTGKLTITGLSSFSDFAIASTLIPLRLPGLIFRRSYKDLPCCFNGKQEANKTQKTVYRIQHQRNRLETNRYRCGCRQQQYDTGI